MTYLLSLPANMARGFFSSLCASILLSGCGGTPTKTQAPVEEPSRQAATADAIPIAEPKSRYGNPRSYVVFGQRHYVLNNSKGFTQEGIASWYGKKFHGKRTSNGETYNMYAMTAAHKNLPLPAYVEVTNLSNQRRAIVRVNDRGPFHDNRIIDLSFAAAKKLDIVKTGTALVHIRSIQPNEPTQATAIGMRKQAVAAHTGTVSFYLQIGAFIIQENAEKLRAQLSALGNEYLLRVSQAVVNNKTLYRVRFGPFHEITTADTVVDKLQQYGITEHQIVIAE